MQPARSLSDGTTPQYSNALRIQNNSSKKPLNWGHKIHAAAAPNPNVTAAELNLSTAVSNAALARLRPRKTPRPNSPKRLGVTRPRAAPPSNE